MTKKRRDPSLTSPLFLVSSLFLRRIVMEAEIIGIILGVVLPLYPLLFAIYQKIGKYDEIVEEFKKLRTEHEAHKEVYHGN
jgi:hypothetical protein